FVQVAAVTGVPNHPVVAGLSEDPIIAGAAGQAVIARATEEEIVTSLAQQRVVAQLAEQKVHGRAAGERVVTAAAIQAGRRKRAVRFIERKLIVAPETKDLNPRCVGNGWRSTDDPYVAAIDQQVSGGVSTHFDGIVRVVTQHGERSAEGKRADRWCYPLTKLF